MALRATLVRWISDHATGSARAVRNDNKRVAQAIALVALTAPAKVNLALHVTGRRPDGYHLLDSIVVFADVGDRIEIAPADGIELQISGPFAAHAPADRTNLAWRAAEAFFAQTGLSPRAAIRIEKTIPAGAGLGGGSADAAAVLSGLNTMFDAGLSPDQLAVIGLRLGADVPMCLAGKALRARGIGQEIEMLRTWPALPLVLVWPGRPVSTAACFAALALRDNPSLREPEELGTPAQVAEWLCRCRNDLEAPALGLEPVIGEVLASLRAAVGCLLARMTGSGSACFALFATDAAAQAAAVSLRELGRDWWIAATTAS